MKNKFVLLCILFFLCLINILNKKEKVSEQTPQIPEEEETSSESESESKEEEDEELLTLTESNFAQYVKSEGHILVLFHNKWCKFSQNLEKKLKQVNKLLKMENQRYYIGTVDVTLENGKSIVQKEVPSHLIDSVFTYPKLVYFKNGIAKEIYNGKHFKSDIYQYIKRKIYTDSIPFSNYYSFEQKISRDRHSFIYFPDLNNRNDTEYDRFNRIAKGNINFMFYHNTEVRTNDLLNSGNNSTLIYYNFGKQKDQLLRTQDFNDNSIFKFIKKNTFNNYYEKFNDDAVNEIFIKKQPAIFFFRNQFDNKTQFLEDNFPLLARGDNDLKYVITDLNGKYELKLAKLLGVMDAELPCIKIVDFKPEIRKFALSGEPTVETVGEFIKQWKRNQLQAFLTSQRIVEEKSKGKEVVKKISTATFSENVLQTRRHAVVFYHTSWCQHCKKVNYFLNYIGHSIFRNFGKKI
jgi:thiol-disulfide isomerase/thioredoxin